MNRLIVTVAFALIAVQGAGCGDRQMAKAELEQAEGTFTGSEFVKQTTGVDNVCERSAMCAGGEKILVHKTAHEGVTVAVAVEKWSVDFE